MRTWPGDFGLEPVDDLLVGFKFIAQVIGGLDDPSRFVFAAEESLGYLAGDFVRDKDAAIGALLVCEMASRLKDRGATVPMYLDELYAEYGYYRNALLLVELPGSAGRDVMTEVMLGLRADPPGSRALAGMAVTARPAEDRLELRRAARGAGRIPHGRARRGHRRRRCSLDRKPCPTTGGRASPSGRRAPSRS